jgi:hypothetical protein
MSLPSPTGKRRLLAKSSWQREWQLCQQHPVKLLANLLDKAVGKEAQLCQQPGPARASGEAHLCQQPGPKLLAKLGRLVRKAQLCQQLWPMPLANLGISPPFFSFLAFNSHIKSTHQHMNQNTTYISTI